MKREQERSPERLKRKKLQKYNCYKKLKKQESVSQKLHKEYYNKLGPYTIVVVFDKNHTKNSAKHIVGSHTPNYKKVLKREGIDIKDVLYVCVEEMKRWGAHSILVYNKLKQNKVKQKYTKPTKKHINYGKGEHRLISLQSTTDSTHFIRIEKWLADDIVPHDEWKIIDKTTYKNLSNRIVYLKNIKPNLNKTPAILFEDNKKILKKIREFKEQVIAIKAKESYKLRKDKWKYCTVKDYTDYISSLRIEPPKPNPVDLTEYLRIKERNRYMRVTMKAKHTRLKKNTFNSPLKKRRLANNLKVTKITIPTKATKAKIVYTKYSYTDKLKYQHKDELLAIELVKLNEQKKYRELRNKRHAERLSNKSTKRIYNINPEIKTKFEAKKQRLEHYRIKLLKERSRRAVKYLKTIHNGTKSDK